VHGPKGRQSSATTAISSTRRSGSFANAIVRRAPDDGRKGSSAGATGVNSQSALTIVSSKALDLERGPASQVVGNLPVIPTSDWAALPLGERSALWPHMLG